MKRIIKRLIVWLVSNLGSSLQKAIVEGLPKGGVVGYAQLQKIAPYHGVTGFVANGDYGVIQGSVSDASVFPQYAKDKVWSAATTQLMMECLSNGGTYLDIGANIGLTTIPVAKNAKVNCMAFEPNPINFELLSRNVETNCQNNNVALHQVALFEREDSLLLEISPDNSGDNRVRLSDLQGQLAEQEWSTVRVEAKPLNTMLANIDHPLVAKIDTQGAEPFILAGGENVLSQAQLIAIEFWPYGMKRMKANSDIVVEFLGRHFSYGMISVGDSDVLGKWRSIDEIVSELRAYATSNVEVFEYLDVFVSKEKRS